MSVVGRVDVSTLYPQQTSVIQTVANNVVVPFATSGTKGCRGGPLVFGVPVPGPEAYFLGTSQQVSSSGKEFPGRPVLGREPTWCLGEHWGPTGGTPLQ